MTLFVHKQIRKFRLSKKMTQEKFAAAIGCSERRLCTLELGDLYPRPKEIEKINGLGAGIHPSIFSPVIQKITRAVRKKDPARSFHSIKTTKQERFWIKKQLYEKGLTYSVVAKKANCNPNSIGVVLSGKKTSNRILRALAEVLGYPSFEALLSAAARGKGAV